MKRKRYLSRTLLIGNGDRCKKFFSYVDSNSLNMNVLGYLSLNDNQGEDELGSIHELEKIIMVLAVDQVILMGKEESIDLKNCITCCEEMGVTILRIDLKENKRIENIHLKKIIKRITDVFISIFALTLFGPLMLIIGIAICLDSKGPAIFKQSRVGKGGRVFEIYKFRTMIIGAEEQKKELMNKNLVEHGYMFKIKDDPRVTRVGKVLRKTSLDEFPQFLNVIKNDMSLVGTRPPTLDEVKKYQRKFWRRLSIKPGITGNWQVNGRSSITDFNRVLEYDLDYIDKWNLLLDFKIILKTIKVLLKIKEAF